MASAITLVAICSAAVGQTTRPADPDHATRLREAAKRPLLEATLTSATGGALDDAARVEIRRSTVLMEEAKDLRQKTDLLAAAQRCGEALAIRDRILGRDHYLTRSAAQAAAALKRCAAASADDHAAIVESDQQLAAAEEAHDRGDYHAALTAAKRAVELRERVLGPNAVDVGRALQAMGNAHLELRRLKDAEPLLARAMAISEAALGERHPELALVLDRIGWLRIHQAAARGFPSGLVENALSALRRAVSIFRATVGETAETAEALDNLGTILAYAREPDAALSSKLRALVIREAVLGRDDKDTGVSLSNLAWLYDKVGMLEEVIPLRKRALSILELGAGPAHPYTLIEVSNLAQAYRQRSMLNEAISLLEDFAGRKRGDAGRPSAERLSLTIGLAAAYLASERRDDASGMLSRAFEQATALHDAGESATATQALAHLGAEYRRQWALEDAIRAYEQARKWDLKRSKAPDEEVNRRAVQLGSLYVEAGRLAEAMPLLQEALRQAEALHGQGTLETYAALLTLGEAFEKAGDLDAAQGLCEKALRIGETNARPRSRPVAHAMNAMGRIHRLRGRFSLAEFFLVEAMEILEDDPQADPGVQIGAKQDLAALHQAAGRHAKAERMLRQTLEQCNALAPEVRGARVDVLRARSLKQLLETLQSPGRPKQPERNALKAELKKVLERLRAARALDADSRAWLKEL